MNRKIQALFYLIAALGLALFAVAISLWFYLSNCTGEGESYLQLFGCIYVGAQAITFLLVSAFAVIRANTRKKFMAHPLCYILIYLPLIVSLCAFSVSLIYSMPQHAIVVFLISVLPALFFGVFVNFADSHLVQARREDACASFVKDYIKNASAIPSQDTVDNEQLARQSRSAYERQFENEKAVAAFRSAWVWYAFFVLLSLGVCALAIYGLYFYFDSVLLVQLIFVTMLALALALHILVILRIKRRMPGSFNFCAIITGICVVLITLLMYTASVMGGMYILSVTLQGFAFFALPGVAMGTCAAFADKNFCAVHAYTQEKKDLPPQINCCAIPVVTTASVQPNSQYVQQNNIDFNQEETMNNNPQTFYRSASERGAKSRDYQGFKILGIILASVMSLMLFLQLRQHLKEFLGWVFSLIDDFDRLLEFLLDVLRNSLGLLVLVASYLALAVVATLRASIWRKKQLSPLCYLLFLIPIGALFISVILVSIGRNVTFLSLLSMFLSSVWLPVLIFTCAILADHFCFLEMCDEQKKAKQTLNAAYTVSQQAGAQSTPYNQPIGTTQAPPFNQPTQSSLSNAPSASTQPTQTYESNSPTEVNPPSSTENAVPSQEEPPQNGF